MVDSPAAVEARALPELTRDANKIIVPVLPSDIDIHAASRCIADLLLVAKIKRAENRIGVIANRVRKNTLMFQSLMRFLEKLDIPIVATIRDSQNYVRAAELGVGIHEMKPYVVKEDLAQWETLLAWLEPERVLAEQPAPMQEQPAPEVIPAPEAVIEGTDDTAAHDARFIITAERRRPAARRSAIAIPDSKSFIRRRLESPRNPRSLRGVIFLPRRRLVFPGTLHLVGPMLVARPGVEVLGDRRVPTTRALHALEPCGVGIAAYRWRRAVGQISPAPV